MPGYISDHIIFAKTMPADSNKAMMFYACIKARTGCCHCDKSVEDTGTAGKAPLIPIHLVNELGVQNPPVLKEPD